MWLLRAKSLELEMFQDEREMAGKYAILSHTWGDEEVSFDDLDQPETRSKIGYAKIQGACRQALLDDLAYVWIDTCCINKNSSAELSEAINSMYRWYYSAAICYAYLSDIPFGTTPVSYSRPLELRDSLRKCRWLTRGWTLQEMIAPAHVLFLDKDWKPLATKAALALHLANITGIDLDVLRDREALTKVSIARRMSWAAHRSTTRVEDRAYSLLGIFNVNIPLLYGEGSRANVRLQEEIIKTSTDLSIFAWDPWLPLHFGLLFAPDFYGFRNASKMISLNDPTEDDSYELNNKGLRINLPVRDLGHSVVAALNCRPSRDAKKLVTLNLKKLAREAPNSRTLQRQERRSVYEIDRAPPKQTAEDCNSLDHWQDALGFWLDGLIWDDMVLLREGKTAIVVLDIDAGLEILGAHPGEDWYPDLNQFRLCSKSTFSRSCGAAVIQDKETSRQNTLGFGQFLGRHYLPSPISLCWIAEPTSGESMEPKQIEEALSRSLESKAPRWYIDEQRRNYICARVLTAGDAKGVSSKAVFGTTFIRIWKTSLDES